MLKKSLFITFILLTSLHVIESNTAKTKTSLTLEETKQQLQQQFNKDQIGKSDTRSGPGYAIDALLEQASIHYLSSLDEYAILKLIHNYTCPAFALQIAKQLAQEFPQANKSLVISLLRRNRRRSITRGSLRLVWKDEPRYVDILLPSALMHWNRTSKEIKNYLCCENERIPQLDGLQEDLQEIAQRVGISCKRITLGCQYLAVLASTIQIRPELNDLFDRRHLLSTIAHELGHKKAQAKYPDICTGNIESDKKEEFFADVLLSPLVGCCLDSAQEMAYYWTRDPFYNGDGTHPSYLTRIKYLRRLHRNLKKDIDYLKARFWKLGFIVRSWARYQRLVPEEINSSYTRVVSYSYSKGLTPQKKEIIAVLKHLQEISPALAQELELSDTLMLKGLTKMSEREFNYYGNELSECIDLWCMHHPDVIKKSAQAVIQKGPIKVKRCF